MSLEKNTRPSKLDQLELDLDSLNLDMVSERYRAHLEELQAWFKITDDSIKIDPDHERLNGPAARLLNKSATKK